MHLFFLVNTFVMSLVYRFFHPAYTSLMLYRFAFYSYPQRKNYFVPLQKIPKFIQQMLLESEDTNFYHHCGIDFRSIKSSLLLNLKLGYIARGGSTITQQLSRTLFLNPKKSFVRKYFEAIIALEIELILPKKKILELYFNYAEWGKGIYGIQSAAYFYYKKPVNELSKDQAARLIAILASPIRYSPYSLFKRKALSSRYQDIMD